MKLSPDIESWLSLGLMDGLGDESERRLLVAFGSPTDILSANVASLERVVSKQAAHSIALGVDKKNLLTLSNGWKTLSTRLSLLLIPTTPVCYSTSLTRHLCSISRDSANYSVLLHLP